MHVRRSSHFARWALALCILAACLPAAGAQTATPAARPRISATRIDVSEAPVINADLSDPAWAKATLVDDFKQVEPVAGAPASERTTLRILYDENAIYFAVHAYDANPGQITVRSMSRDGPLYTGDEITIQLDPGMTRRNAYNFELGASGGRGDSLILNNSEELDEWNAIWSGQARIVSDGWVAEIAIPFRSLSYDAARSDWGFEFARDIKHKNEKVQWASHNPALDYTDVSQAGTLTGIANIHQGLGLDLQVYGALHAKRDWQIPGDEIGTSFTAGGNAFYRITPALTGTLTVNPDFSDAPLDTREINLTRFSLFTPETRDFFLQDAEAFEFGGLNYGEEDNGRPFFSRNIGLVKGVPVSIVAGEKLSGEYAGFGIGALSVLTDRTGAAPGQVLSVLRASHPVFAESQLGFIVTNGDPTGATDNSVAGADFQYRNSHFLGDGIVVADAFYERSFLSARNEDDSFGVAVSLPNEPWGGDFAFKEIGKDYLPALGFINRPGIRTYDFNPRYRIRYGGNFLRVLDITAKNNFITGLSGSLETRENEISADVETASDDEITFRVTNDFENVPEIFDLPGGVLVPAGRYQWTNVGIELESSDRRPLAGSVEISCCSFYNGRSIDAEFELHYRPSAYYEIAASYELSALDMPGGSATIHVATLDSTVNFTPDMQIAFQAQYDNISADFGFLARYRWEFAPGDELFVAIGQAAVVPGGRFVAHRSQLSVRVGHTFRF